MEEVCRPEEENMLKNKPYLVSFHETILVSLWTFQPTLVYHISLCFLTTSEANTDDMAVDVECNYFSIFYVCRVLLNMGHFWQSFTVLQASACSHSFSLSLLVLSISIFLSPSLSLYLSLTHTHMHIHMHIFFLSELSLSCKHWCKE